MRINNAKTAAIIITVLLMASATLMAMPVQPVKAQTSSVQPTISIPSGARAPNVTTKTVPYLSFRPNPIGLGQLLLVNAWLSPSLSNDRYFMSSTTGSLQLTITKPDGNTEVVKMRSSLEDAASWYEFAPDQ